MFARCSNRSLLLPTPLPEDAKAMPAPGAPGPGYAGEPVRQAVIDRYQIPADDLVYMNEFNEWLHSKATAVRVHLMRFTTFEAPAPWLAPFEAVFKPISELRCSNPTELLLLRQVYNLIITGGGQQR